MEEIMGYLNGLLVSDGIVIAVGAYVTGVIIKESLGFIANRYIPLICGLLGAAAGALVPGIFPNEGIFTAAVNGLALGWAATGGYETVRNLVSGGM